MYRATKLLLASLAVFLFVKVGRAPVVEEGTH